MDVPNATDLTGLPEKVQLHILTGLVVFKILGEVYSAIRTGGGLRRMFRSIWFGENIPAPVAADYKAELAKPPVPPISNP